MPRLAFNHGLYYYARYVVWSCPVATYAKMECIIFSDLFLGPCRDLCLKMVKSRVKSRVYVC